jgi:hypothetical protein
MIQPYHLSMPIDSLEVFLISNEREENKRTLNASAPGSLMLRLCTRPSTAPHWIISQRQRLGLSPFVYSPCLEPCQAHRGDSGGVFGYVEKYSRCSVWLYWTYMAVETVFLHHDFYLAGLANWKKESYHTNISCLQPLRCWKQVPGGLQKQEVQQTHKTSLHHSWRSEWPQQSLVPKWVTHPSSRSWRAHRMTRKRKPEPATKIIHSGRVHISQMYLECW